MKWIAALVVCVIVSGCQSMSTESQTWRALRLRCEARHEPAGIDVDRPRLSWRVGEEDPAGRGQVQTAYRVLVASDPRMLGRERGDLWDSGRVESERTHDVEYDGEPLTSGRRCWWKVRSWDAMGRPSPWSEPASFSTGILDPSLWQAQWIGHDVEVTAEEGEFLLPPARYLRHEFEVPRAVRRATLYASALGIFEVRINGEEVGDDWFTPGWTDYDKRVYYNTYDVTGALREGPNAIASTVADGWYAGYVGYKPERNHYGEQIRFLAQLVVEYEDGSTETIATGPDWKASLGPLLEADFLMGEVYDARREMPGWSEAGFDDAGWEAVDVTAEIGALLQAYPAQTVGEIAVFEPVAITEPKPGVWVFDLGQNFAGVVRIAVEEEAGQEIVLRHAERLDTDGMIYTENLRAARCTDRYICRGGGREEWTPRFTFHGFQYLEITGLTSPPSPGSIVGIALGSRTPSAGSFECSDPTVNQLFRNIFWTQRMNFLDIPTDCPQRDERLGWTGDAQIYVRTATQLCDVQAFFTKWLVDLADTQREDGQFPMVAPLKVAGSDGGPAWADAGVICPWTIFDVYGDERLLAKHYEGMKRFLAFCEERCTEDLLPPAEFHCFGDWVNIGADTPHDVIYTAYFAHSTALTARAARALGHEEDAARYEELFVRIREAFNRAYVEDDGSIKGNTQACYVMALAFDLLEGDRREKGARRLIDRIEARDGHLSTGFVGTKDLMLVLSKIGRDDVAYRLLHNDTFPSWGFSIKHGATTIWERWNGWTPEDGFATPGMNSFAHYSFGAVGQWIVQTIGGINNSAPGFAEILIRPRPGGKIEWARTSYESIHGLVITDWKKTEDAFFLDVTIPPNTRATIHVPSRSPAEVTEGGNSIEAASGVRLAGWEDGATILEVGSGYYRFRAR
jgi:alpha-L-rhamnosidase